MQLRVDYPQFGGRPNATARVLMERRRRRLHCPRRLRARLLGRELYELLALNVPGSVWIDVVAVAGRGILGLPTDGGMI